MHRSTVITAAAIAACAVLAGSPRTAAASGERGVAQPAGIGVIEIKKSLRDRPGPLDWLMDDGSQPTLREVIEQFDSTAKRDDLDGVLIRLRDPRLTVTQIEELGGAIARIRESGKRVHLYSDQMGTQELLLGAHADEIIGQTGTWISLPGLYMEEIYLADTLRWIGIEADMVQVGDYKGASDPLARSEPSPEWDENINTLLDGLYSALRTTIKQGRGMTDGQLDRAMEQVWFAPIEKGVEVGLIDAVIDLPQLEEHLEASYESAIAWRTTEPPSRESRIDPSNPFAIFQILAKKPDHSPKRASIAIVHISGPIMDGESSAGFFGGETVGSRSIRRHLQTIEEEDLIRGVVVRIDSPGGSASASEVIWQGIRRVTEKKPVWVSVGSMAASGGYYIAVSGDRIYLNPSSIVGSIGVVGGKLAMGGLYDKVRVNVVERSRGPRSDLFSTSATWTDAQRNEMRQRMMNIYDLFSDRVQRGRPGIDLDRTGAGRLFAGDDAVRLKMADRIGSFDDAIRDLASDLGLEEGEYDILHYPGPRTIEQMLEDVFGGFSAAPAGGEAFPTAKAVREIIGEQRWDAIRANIEGVMQLRREPVLLISPRALIIR